MSVASCLCPTAAENILCYYWIVLYSLSDFDRFVNRSVEHEIQYCSSVCPRSFSCLYICLSFYFLVSNSNNNRLCCTMYNSAINELYLVQISGLWVSSLLNSHCFSNYIKTCFHWSRHWCRLAYKVCRLLQSLLHTLPKW